MIWGDEDVFCGRLLMVVVGLEVRDSTVGRGKMFASFDLKGKMCSTNSTWRE